MYLLKRRIQRERRYIIFIFLDNSFIMKVVYFAPTSTLYGDNIALLNILQVLALKNVCFLIITSREGEFTLKLRELGYEYALCNFNPVWWPTISSFRDIVLFLPRLVIINYLDIYWWIEEGLER